jgi:hypothetical protein
MVLTVMTVPRSVSPPEDGCRYLATLSYPMGGSGGVGCEEIGWVACTLQEGGMRVVRVCWIDTFTLTCLMVVIITILMVKHNAWKDKKRGRD